MNYEVNIGIEVHVQLTTKSKIFCRCSNGFSPKPNTNVCQICTGQPGVLPLLNEEVVIDAIKAGIATNCQISPFSLFARKHYFYPDLPKNYQITQSNLPICQDGYLTIKTEDGHKKNIRLIRIHMEEDAGKNIHASQDESFVDLNRAGTPLLEIVTHPDISSSFEAREYLKQLRGIVQYLGICTGNMEEGAFRADTNISVRKKGATQLGTRCELKNINSFKFIADAIEYEIKRQIDLLETGQQVVQETRLWDTKEHKSKPMRSKEMAADYRYFDDPDLPAIEISKELIEKVRKTLPELPHQIHERLTQVHNIKDYEADILIDDPGLLHYYQASYKFSKSKNLINWILRNLAGYLKESKIAIEESKVTPQGLAELVDMIDKGTINNRSAQEIFDQMVATGKTAPVLVKELGLEQIGSNEEIENIVKEIVESNKAQADEYRSGREKVFGFFVGAVMAKTKGRANPQMVNELLKKYLK